MGLLDSLTQPKPVESRREHRKKVKQAQNVGKKSSRKQIRNAYDRKYGRESHWFFR